MGPAHQCCLATAQTDTACRAWRQHTGPGGRQEMGCQDLLQEMKRPIPHPALRICFTPSRMHGKGPLGTHTFPTRTWETRPFPPNEGVTCQGVQGGMEIPVTRCTWLPLLPRPPSPAGGAETNSCLDPAGHWRAPWRQRHARDPELG